ncbi:thiamine biosynthesis protein ApbE [Flavonifractor sp. An112]|uniref:FAD:protein FMN transferase n=1 Tax=Flavonifractor sp. An112 TaxID=1965544 RepID=UPI000B3AE51B|nr:FAD:protein FMN transferase [Flavonifractor sp. An112]OUQ61647.1 thiamine biosynthesis protein ApbE [Flavonifractor sp. An112]
MKRTATLILLLVLLCGCTAAPAKSNDTGLNRYEATFLTLFDTVTTIVGYAETEEAFTDTAQAFHDELLEYHQLYDIYNEYEGINNIKTINDHGWEHPIKVDQRIIDLLLFSKELYTQTEGRVNIAMGSVLRLWHDARETGIADPSRAALPDQAALEQAAAHTDIDSIQIDVEESTVFLSDPEVKLDVGAIAKGYAVEQVCRNTPSGLLISVGGNVCPTGPKPESGQPWVVGIQDPEDPEQYLHTIYVEDVSVVTSGDYQRYFTVDGVPYHHIIDPDTNYPAGYWRSVTILCRDSGVADALSTALFTLPQEEGQALLDAFQAEAMWVRQDGTILYSPGFQAYIRI